MPRVRLGVVLLVPPPVAHEVDGLRRALGDPALGRVPPHITLVPPLNVGVDELPDVLAGLRSASVEGHPLSLELGPPRTFGTDEGVVYLAVGGDGATSGTLASLQERARRGPLGRPLEHDFIPHVTLSTGVAADLVPQVLDALAGFRDRAVRVDRLHLLQQQATPPHRWEPVADVPLRPPVIVGRGGLPIELTASELVDPEARSFLVERETPAAAVWPGDTRPLVVVARREGTVAGVARGWTAGPVAELVSIVLADEHDGTGEHARAAWWSAAADRGAS